MVLAVRVRAVWASMPTDTARRTIISAMRKNQAGEEPLTLMMSSIWLSSMTATAPAAEKRSSTAWKRSAGTPSALATAGITDAKIIVAAPFEVSGTAALTGVYLAYEDITGEELDETAKLVSTQELTLTAELAEQIGSYDSVEIVNELKLLLAETKNMTDEELRAEIVSIASDLGVTLTDTQINQLISLCRSLEKLDPDQLKEKVESVQNTIAKLGQAKEKVAGFIEGVKNVWNSVVNFFKNLFS